MMTDGYSRGWQSSDELIGKENRDFNRDNRDRNREIVTVTIICGEVFCGREISALPSSEECKNVWLGLNGSSCLTFRQPNAFEPFFERGTINSQ
jgi:hypothetical protein